METTARVGNWRYPLNEWWEGWCGSQSVDEFLSYGTGTARAQVAAYVDTIEAARLDELNIDCTADDAPRYPSRGGLRREEAVVRQPIGALRAQLTDALTAYIEATRDPDGE